MGSISDHSLSFFRWKDSVSRGKISRYWYKYSVKYGGQIHFHGAERSTFKSNFCVRRRSEEVPSNTFFSNNISLSSLVVSKRVFFQTVEMDPCLDDCVMFSRRLRDLGCNVGLDILPGLPHGFLNFSLVSIIGLL